MEVFRFNILPMEELERREAFKEAVNCCPICQNTLRFDYETDFVTNSITEEALCEKCSLQIREEKHKIQ